MGFDETGFYNKPEIQTLKLKLNPQNPNLKTLDPIPSKHVPPRRGKMRPRTPKNTTDALLANFGAGLGLGFRV